MEEITERPNRKGEGTEYIKRQGVKSKGDTKRMRDRIQKRIKKRIKDDRGSFTIEAAVVISFLVIVINMILVLAFFLYSRCSLERAAAMGALRGSQALWEDNSLRCQKADEGVDEILTYNLLGTDTVEKEITVKKDQISVALDMRIRQWDYHTEVKKKCINPVLFIRSCRKLEGVGKEQK